MNGTITRVLALLVTLAFAGGTAAAGDPADALGELYRGDPQEAGRLAPIASGSLLAGEIFRTGTDYALIHLDNGGVLKLSESSAIRARREGADRFEVRVLSGHAALLGETGRLLRAGAGSVVVLGPTSVDPGAAERRLIADVESGNAYRGRTGREAERSRLRAERR